ncbi:MAG: hypothetical protein V4490_00205 [Pseudomonadota bacterium]
MLFIVSLIMTSMTVCADPNIVPSQNIDMEWNSQTPEGQGYWQNGVWVNLEAEGEGYWQNGVWITIEPDKKASGYWDPIEAPNGAMDTGDTGAVSSESQY